MERIKHRSILLAALAATIAVVAAVAARASAGSRTNAYAAIARVAGAVDVRCDSPAEWKRDPRSRADLAYTYFVDGRARYIVLGPSICPALNELLESPDAVVWRTNPLLALRGRQVSAESRAREMKLYWKSIHHDYLEGQAALVYLHELNHLRRNERNESIVECAALHELPRWLRSVVHVPAWRIPSLLEHAAMFDLGLPPVYHHCDRPAWDRAVLVHYIP